ncbi:DNA repair protein RAD50 [Echinococcus granulosus]|uniref:DNA repair protein RAD50 n=1 Tax=Echinococcus granulosus TaxID=6210 RepID=W6UTY4_ECHGR|nr:DNA repair protein RAD50 [Echinococcus granulosus]EUB65095.1 DNA repair protein RAD50 [Echinococcus granulosus]
MSLLEEVCIQGIRSFGPENPQRIKFSTPVTLILGPNGTGKTICTYRIQTIIECLRYAVTGELPPGSKTGASFIHDPKLAHSAEVKAKVALKLRDVKNCPLVVARSLVATQRGTAKQPSLKTLDGTIKRLSPTGDVVSHSYRCGEIDREVTFTSLLKKMRAYNALGACKAVFDNVIFCHQEESNWPLHEAKAVKERFDDLFASSRYVKALDAIRKRQMRKFIETKCQRIDTKRALDEQKQILSKVDEELDPVNTQLTLYRKKYKELVQYQADARACAVEKTRLEAILRDLTEQITSEFEGTDEELKDAIEQADERLDEKHLSFAAAERDLRQLQTSIHTNEKNRSDLIVQRTQLDIEVKRQEEALKRRNEILGELCVKFNIHEVTKKLSNTDNMADADVETVRKYLEAALQRAESQMETTKLSVESDSRRAQKVIDEARSALVRVEQSIASQESALADNVKEMAEVELKLRQAKSAGGELERINNKLAKAVETRELLESSRDEAQIRKSIEGTQAELSSCESQITNLDNQIVEAQKSAMANHERSMLESSKKAAIETAKKLRNRNLDLLEQIFTGEPIPPVRVDGSQTSNSLTKAFNKRFDELARSSKATQQNLNMLHRDLSKMETVMSFQRCFWAATILGSRDLISLGVCFPRKQLHEKEDTLRVMEERLISACGSVDLEHKLDNLMSRKKQLERDCEIEEGGLHLWKKFRDRLVNESVCPLCHRGFENEQDHQDLEEEIEKRIATMPRDLDTKRKELQEMIIQYETFIQLKPEINKFAKLRGTELPELKAEVQTTQSSLEKLQNEIANETSKLEVIQADESVARSLQGDMAVIEKTEKEIANLNRSLTSLTPVDENTTLRPVAELQEERDSLRAKCNLLSTAINDYRKKLDQDLAKRQKATDEENELRSALLKLEKEFQAVTSLNTELERLTSVGTRITGKLEDLSGQLPICKAALLTAENDKQRVTKEGSDKVAIASAEWQEWRDRSRQVKEACDTAVLKVDDAESPRDHLKRVTAELAELDATTEALKSAVVTTSKRVEDLRTEIANHKVVQRELGDCVRLRETRGHLSLLNERVQDIQRQIDVCQSGISESVDLEDHINNLSNEEERLRSQKQAINDKVMQLQTELQMLERSLAEKYADAEAEYIKKMYELRTTEMVATDLQRYYKALDGAIIAYHAEKMNEVNQIIRELWRTTYRGNDIDHIKICSEEESPTTNANASSTRRTYKYRVVMVKADSSTVMTGGGKQARLASTETQLDMRGRCSAGQKVLASLVIRLALAEVFCLQCGVLALDEPTTNLDRENIESLAYALTEIIKTRSSQRNFQLIIITHDEDFIELLGRAGCAGHLQRLVRNLEGLSEVQKVRMEDQFLEVT